MSSDTPRYDDEDLDDDGAPRFLKVLVGLIVVLAATVVVGVLAALTFSVQVSGRSMEPTLHHGDRLITDVTDRSHIARFDLVGARVEGVGVVVKRVIGMPGDTLRIVEQDGVPRVLVRPAGSTRDEVVVNPAWADRIAGNTKPCCREDGTNSPKPTGVTVPDGEYWLIGDNWGGSDDSRFFGFVAADQIGASLNFRILPLGDLGPVAHDVSLQPVE